VRRPHTCCVLLTLVSAASTNPAYRKPINKQAGLTRLQALLAITRYGSEWLKMDKHVGSLEVGKFADLQILKNDYFKQSDDMIGRNAVCCAMTGLLC
jgi:predicted amidohydrolase YtcJ